MKKLVVLVALIAVNFPTNAQWKKIKGNGNVTTSNRTVSEYDKIGVSGSFDIKLISGNEGDLSIVAESNLLDYLITEVEDGNLKIKWKKGVNIKTNKKIVITIPFMDIEEVALAGSGDVTSSDVIKADNFKAALSGSGDFNLQLNVNTLKSAISGSGDMNLSGTATSYNCAISGSGDVDAVDLVTNISTVRIAGSGDVSVSVKDELDAKVSGSGDISYKGSPSKNSSKVSGSGSVKSI